MGVGGGRASEAIHHPVQRLADARVLVADLQRGRQKPQISREAEQCACSPCQLFGRLQLLRGGAAEAERRRGGAAEVEGKWQAQAVCIRQGLAAMRQGFSKLV